MKKRTDGRQFDELGRVVIPIDIRRDLGWYEHMPVNILQLGPYVLLYSGDKKKHSYKKPNPDNPLFCDLHREVNALSADNALIVLQLLQSLNSQRPCEET